MIMMMIINTKHKCDKDDDDDNNTKHKDDNKDDDDDNTKHDDDDDDDDDDDTKLSSVYTILEVTI
jgi:hypothetical protein